MRILTSDKGVKITFYASAKECPIDRYIEFQKYLIIESGIGSSISDVSLRYSKIKAFIEEGKLQDALIENENAFKCVNSALNGVSYMSIAFACLVATMGGEICEDLTEEGLQLVAEKIKTCGLTQQNLEDSIEDVKKKINDELNSFYSDNQINIDLLDYLSKIKKYILVVAESYSNLEPENLDDVKHAYNWFLTDGGSKNFRVDDKENCVIQIEKQFHSLCSVMEQNNVVNPEKCTVLQFYGKIYYINKQLSDG